MMVGDDKNTTDAKGSPFASREMIVFYIISFVLFFGYSVYKSHNERLIQELNTAAVKIQKTLPREVAPGLISFRVSSSDADIFFDYKFTNLTLDEVNSRKADALNPDVILEPDAILELCNLFDTSVKLGAIIHLRYYDKTEIYAHEVVLDADKCDN